MNIIKIKITAFMLSCMFFAMPAHSRTITDMAGRTVSVPDKIERILPYDSKTSILLYPVAFDLMAAKAKLPGTKKYSFIAEEYNAMPQVDINSTEEVLAAAPLVVIAGVYESDGRFESFAKLERLTGIPVVVVDLSVDKLDRTYRFLGNLLGRESKAAVLIQFLDIIYKQTGSLIAENQGGEKRVYYCLGSTGLMTDPAGSKHTEVLDYLQMDNAAKIPVPSGGHATVNIEQILEWNPDYILAAGFRAERNAYQAITSSQRWATVNAVKNQRVYKVPSRPYGWLDHPPSVNRISGVIWLSGIFYRLPADIVKKQITDFYRLFYHYHLSEREYKALFE